MLLKFICLNHESLIDHINMYHQIREIVDLTYGLYSSLLPYLLLLLIPSPLQNTAAPSPASASASLLDFPYYQTQKTSLS